MGGAGRAIALDAGALNAAIKTAVKHGAIFI
jgi:hypothetical protein